jgi:choline kinase
MRAIILAAGRGQRLQQPEHQQIPKCLLRFGGKTLLERHLLALGACGVSEVVLALGFKRELIEAEVDGMRVGPPPEIVINPAFDLGSVLTVHTAAEPLGRGGEVLLMDADVLYHGQILKALVAGERAVNRVLMDRDFEAGDEPVKL